MLSIKRGLFALLDNVLRRSLAIREGHMGLRLLFVVMGGFIAAVPAIAQETPVSAPAPDPDKKVCRTITPTGSIMGKRFCLTKAEWKKLNEINGANAETGLDGRRLRARKGDGEP
jgi:hypothetical protein